MFSCDKDDAVYLEKNPETVIQNKVQIKEGNNVSKSAIDYIRLKTNNYFTVSTKKHTVKLSVKSFASKSTDLGIVDTSKEVVVLNEKNTKHTFKVITPLEENSVTNLIVVESENSIYEYFLKYTFIGSPPIDSETKAIDFSRFNGTIETFDENGNSIGSITVQEGIVAEDDGQFAPCPSEPSDDPIDEPTDDNSNDDDSPGNPNTSGGIPGSNDDSSAPVDNTGNGGWFASSSNDDCRISWRYSNCGCGIQYANGHEPSGNACCSGSSLIITDCSGGILHNRNSDDNQMMMKTNPLNPCDDGAVAVIIDKDNDCDTSKEDLKKVFPNASDDNMKLLAKVINDYGKDFGIDSDEKLWHFLSQAGHEVGGEFANGLGTTESLHYTTASRLKKIYKKYFQQNATDTINKRLADSTYLRNSAKVANYVYANRLGNSNEASGEGYKYRGRGIFQLTGKSNYQSFKTFYNNKYDPDIDPVTTPSLLKSNDTLAVMSALWYYKKRVLDKITVDSLSTVRKVTKKVNGGRNGLTHRKKIFKKAKDSITCK